MGWSHAAAERLWRVICSFARFAEGICRWKSKKPKVLHRRCVIVSVSVAHRFPKGSLCVWNVGEKLRIEIYCKIGFVKTANFMRCASIVCCFLLWCFYGVLNDDKVVGIPEKAALDIIKIPFVLLAIQQILLQLLAWIRSGSNIREIWKEMFVGSAWNILVDKNWEWYYSKAEVRYI